MQNKYLSIYMRLVFSFAFAFIYFQLFCCCEQGYFHCIHSIHLYTCFCTIRFHENDDVPFHKDKYGNKIYYTFVQQSVFSTTYKYSLSNVKMCNVYRCFSSVSLLLLILIFIFVVIFFAVAFAFDINLVLLYDKREKKIKGKHTF